MASPGGKLSRTARLMRNGEHSNLPMHRRKTHQIRTKYAFFECSCYPTCRRSSSPPVCATSVPSPRGKVFSQARQSFKFQFVVLLLYADSLNWNLSLCAAKKQPAEAGCFQWIIYQSSIFSNSSIYLPAGTFQLKSCSISRRCRARKPSRLWLYRFRQRFRLARKSSAL